MHYQSCSQQPSRRTPLLSTTALGVAVLLLALSAPAVSQPRAILQWATSQGLGNQFTISRVPVVNSTGAIKYYDISLALTVDATGKPTLNTTTVKITPSPDLILGAFKPGVYRYDGCNYAVGAPGVAAGGRTTGSIGGSTTCSAVLNVAWTTGPITGHPNEASLKAAGITFQGFSWGTVGETDFWSGWEPGDIVGVVQSGQQIAVHNFGSDNKEDTSAVFTLCASCAN